MNQQERQNRIIARGEFSDHCHTITGEAKIERNSKGEVLITVGNTDCVLKHILESAWITEGKEVWTNEHHDVNLSDNDPLVEVGGFICRHGDVALKKVAPKTYCYVHQTVFDPLTKRIENAKD